MTMTGRHDLFRDVTDFVFLRDEPQRAQVIFVPGASFDGHVRLAADLYNRGYAPLILPSGRFAKGKRQFGDGTYPSEWAYMRQILFSLGVPEEAVLREDQATFTWENALLSRKVLDDRQMIVEKAILCCRPFHARRALLYYQAAFPGAEFFVCPAEEPGLDRDDWFRSAEGRDRVFSEVQKLGSQVRPQAEMLLEEGMK